MKCARTSASRTRRSRHAPWPKRPPASWRDQLKKKGGTIKEAIIDGYRVLTIPPISRKQGQSRIASPFGEAPEESAIPDVPYAGEAFRDAYFNLQPGSIATAANQPKTILYVMALDKREPATFTALYAPYSDKGSYESTARLQAARQLAEEWMKWLRQKAGLRTTGSRRTRSKARPHPTKPRLARRRIEHIVLTLLAHRLPRTIRQIQASGHVTSSAIAAVCVHPRTASGPSGVAGPSTRSPIATTTGARPKSTTSPSLNSCSRAGITKMPRTIQYAPINSHARSAQVVREAAGVGSLAPAVVSPDRGCSGESSVLAAPAPLAAGARRESLRRSMMIGPLIASPSQA